MTKWVYGFGGGSAEGRSDMRELLGGKGANLAEMSNLGLPVPPGFTITTEVCTAFYDNDRAYPAGLDSEVENALGAVEKLVGRKFGDAKDPLLVSVRSGARASMPGMMDTVLNLGLNDETVEGLAKVSGDRRFAYDSYRRFIQMYGDVVLGVDHYHFEEILEMHKEDKGYSLDTEMGADDWADVVGQFKKKVQSELDAPFPQDPREQLWGAIGAVFGSWMNARANTYRRLHNIPASWGTAVNVQAMVFGNMGDDCATGVCFSRNPSTGENRFYGEYLINAQGEDVVAGIRTPAPLTKIEREESGSDLTSMEEALPGVFGELCDIRDKLESHYRDMQDMEFTVESGKLYMLQTRAGKRTAKAALRIAVEMCRDGVISQEDALRRVDPAQLDQLLHPTLDPDAERKVVGMGLPASPGAASGQIVFSAESAEEWVSNKGRKVILTNGSLGHAQNVTQRLGIADHFDAVYDIAALGFEPKPRASAYDRFLELSGTEPMRAAMFEDIARNLEVPHMLGMTTVWVRPGPPPGPDSSVARHERLSHEGADGPHIHHVTDDLKTFLEAL